jgi:pimeloyl-ACP methyl ester carboxylesterase
LIAGAGAASPGRRDHRRAHTRRDSNSSRKTSLVCQKPIAFDDKLQHIDLAEDNHARPSTSRYSGRPGSHPAAFISDIVLAEPTPAPVIAEDQRMLPYVEPGQLVDIGGRRINMHCTGAGGPTVVLMAGIFSWSVVWYKTQPVISQSTRVCAFDRAGYGFSDPGPKPQILSDVVDDLHAALNAGPMQGPYVLVGHSLGGIEARLYAQRWPKEVVGIVLVDTALAGEGLIDENQPGFDEAIGGESYAADMLHCAFLVMHPGGKAGHRKASGSTNPTRRSGLPCRRRSRSSLRTAYTGSSRDRVTRLSWISLRQS